MSCSKRRSSGHPPSLVGSCGSSGSFIEDKDRKESKLGKNRIGNLHDVDRSKEMIDSSALRPASPESFGSPFANVLPPTGIKAQAIQRLSQRCVGVGMLYGCRCGCACLRAKLECIQSSACSDDVRHTMF